MGTLADFLEVDGQYEAIVDEFLRDELNYVVVKSWDAADAGVRLLASDVAGRATFLVHGEEDVKRQLGLANTLPIPEGVVALKDCIRVLNGFGNSLESLLPKLGDGFIAPDSATARRLAEEHPRGYFLSPSGEAFHNATVTGGHVRAQGPLALKRELNEVQHKLDAAQAELAQAEQEAATLERELRELTSRTRRQDPGMPRRGARVGQLRRGAAPDGVRRRRASSAACRSGRWPASTTAKPAHRSRKPSPAISRRQQHSRPSAQRLNRRLPSYSSSSMAFASSAKTLQQAAAEAAAALAGLEERRRNAAATFEQTQRMADAQSARIHQIEQQLEAAGGKSPSRAGDRRASRPARWPWPRPAPAPWPMEPV